MAAWSSLGAFACSGQDAVVPHTPTDTLVIDLRLGARDRPTRAFASVQDVEVSEDGTIYVLDALDRMVKVFDRSGGIVGTIGRQGAGPGEFNRPNQLGWKADSLWVADPGHQRISFFSPDGDFLASTRFDVSVLLDAQFGSRFTRGAVAADGSLLFEPTIGVARLVEEGSAFMPVLRVAGEGGRPDTVAVLPVLRRYLAIRDPNARDRVLYGPQPFDDTPIYAVAPDGDAVVLVERWSAEPRFGVTRLTIGGDTVFHRTYAYRREPISREQVDSLVEVWVARVLESPAFGAPPPRTAEKWVRDALIVPGNIPPVGDVVVGYDGRIWLKRDDLRGAPAYWQVLDGATGEPAGSVAAPHALRIVRASDEYAWGVELDELDVPHVVRYRIARAGGEPAQRDGRSDASTGP